MSSQARSSSTRSTGGSLLIKPDKEEMHSVGDHSVPETPTKKSLHGTVVAVVFDRGQYGTKISMTFKADGIVYEKYTGTEISLDDDDMWIIMRKSDIPGIVESDPDTTRDNIDNETFDDLDQNIIIHSIKEYLLSMNDQITNLTNRIKSRLDDTEYLYR